MRQCVKRRQTEDLLVGSLKPWIGIAACGRDIRHAIERIILRQQPARSEKNGCNLAEHLMDDASRQSLPDEDVTSLAKLSLKLVPGKVASFEFTKCLHGNIPSGMEFAEFCTKAP